MIPPISFFRRNEMPRSEYLAFIHKNFPDEFQFSLLFSSISDQQHFHQWITHIFVHTNYEHMFLNLFDTIVCGYSVYNEVGIIGMYAVFIGGGMFSAISIPSTTENFKLLLSKLCEPNFQWTNLVNIVPKQSACGSPGAVCALVGCNLCLTFRDIFSYFLSKPLEPPLTNTNMSSSEDTPSNELATTPEINMGDLTTFLKQMITMPIYIGFKLFEIYCNVAILKRETQRVFEQSSSTHNFIGDKLLGYWLKYTNADHCDWGTIQGMVFGISFGTLFGIVIPSYQRKINRHRILSNLKNDHF